MYDLAELQTFLTKIEGGSVAVDLFKIGQKHYEEHAPAGNKSNKHNGNFRVALDLEDCLDRFYGGYYSDWACGGQWNRAYQFVQLLASAFKHAHVDVIAFFDGTLKKNKKSTAERNDFRQKTISVLKHIRMIGTPPPKIWWLPPSGIRTVLRNALRSVHIQIVQTVNDHTMEVIEYFHEQKLDAILGLHPDYIIANTSRYFSSHDLRLSYKGALETKEYMVSKLLASLSLTADHLPFIAVFLGGYILIDEVKLKGIYERLKLESNLDFDVRIRKIAEIVRNSPTTDIEEFIKHLNLADFEKEIRESVEYYQRRGKFANKKYQGSKKRNELIRPVAVTDPPMPFASETSETDEAAKKRLIDASAAADAEHSTDGSGDNVNKTAGKIDSKKSDDSKEIPSTGATAKTIHPFVYTLPAEVLKTSLNRHQRGIMDSKIYQLLIKKEIILPQVLEDEQYREIPSVHLFYRPARQMIYAILFNLYHQKYLCSKRSATGENVASGNNTQQNKKDNKKDKKDVNAGGQKPPEIQVAEWIWSPQNEYKKPTLVSATPLPWAVPTIQRLWFGMAFDDKQRRMRAFLTIMRSDSPLMLNRGYVPQHMLVMACVLRFIVTSPDRNILTMHELDAFLATAFSPQLPMVENTQELVLPGVHLRGVYLATLFMQGVETASLANDACGVPLPWTMINPWLFFDGKLFHLKLKMSTYVATIRELCDDHIEIVLKIERFRKAILEDVEHFLLPAAHMDPMYRPGFLPQPSIPLQAFNKNSSSVTNSASSLHPLAAAAAAANANNAIFYGPSPYFALSSALLGREAVTGVNPPQHSNSGNMNGGGGRNNRNQQIGANNRNVQNRKGYQLKVGGIVTGSWAAGGHAAAAAAAARSLFGAASNVNNIHGSRLANRLSGNLAAARIGLNNRAAKMTLAGGANNPLANALAAGAAASRLNHRNMNPHLMPPRNLSRSYGSNKITNPRNRSRNKRKDNRKKDGSDKTTITTSNIKLDVAKIENTTIVSLTSLSSSSSTFTTTTAINTITNTVTADSSVTLSSPTSYSSTSASSSSSAAATATAGSPTSTEFKKKSSISEEANSSDSILIDQIKGIILTESAAELQNGTTVLASDLANSMCDLILKDEESNEIGVLSQALHEVVEGGGGAAAACAAAVTKSSTDLTSSLSPKKTLSSPIKTTLSLKLSASSTSSSPSHVSRKLNNSDDGDINSTCKTTTAVNTETTNVSLNV